MRPKHAFSTPCEANHRATWRSLWHLCKFAKPNLTYVKPVTSLRSLMILLLQLVFTVSLAAALRFGAMSAVRDAFRPRTSRSLAVLLVACLGLPLLSLVKDRHPWNLIATTLWSAVFGLFLAVCLLLPDNGQRTHKRRSRSGPPEHTPPPPSLVRSTRGTTSAALAAAAAARA